MMTGRTTRLLLAALLGLLLTAVAQEQHEAAPPPQPGAQQQQHQHQQHQQHQHQQQHAQAASGGQDRTGASACLPPPGLTREQARDVAEAFAALDSLYYKLNGSHWTMRELSNDPSITGSLRWGSCDPCWADDGHDAGAADDAAPAAVAVAGQRHGVQPLPSYCCWRGVSCCHEQNTSSIEGPVRGGTGTRSRSWLARCPGLPRPGLQPRSCPPHAVAELQLLGFGAHGPFHGVLPELQVLHRQGLQHLDLSKNQLTGTLPQEIGSLGNLTGLLLGSNNISGSVPPSLMHLRRVRQLDLQINKLGGSLALGQLCGDEDNDLELLLIRGNNFSGPLDLRKCKRLQLADIQGNRFSGSLPVDGSNERLSVLNSQHNYFSGSIPLSLWDLPALMALDLTNNSLVGTLPRAVASANFLTQLRLGSNRLHGTVPFAITMLSHLADLDLSYNRELQGTLPRMTWLLGLQSLSIRNTKIQGTIPRELEGLPYLEYVDLRDTRMTCCTSLREAQARRANGTLLPTYLSINDPRPPGDGGGGAKGDGEAGAAAGAADELTASYEEYITAGGKMKCGMVKRAPAHAVVAQGWVAKPMNVSRQTWLVPPEYTWFMRCTCVKGYEPGVLQQQREFPILCAPPGVAAPPMRAGGAAPPGWAVPLAARGNASAALRPGLLHALVAGGGADGARHPACEDFMTVMTCKPVPPTLNSSAIAGIVVAGALLVLALLLAHVAATRVSRVRRQLEWWRKHLAGMPRYGDMSLVVTDIEGYSGLFKRAPEPMYRALTLHNNVIRRAKFAHCGSIVQQEGDSFTLAFHSPFDAVAFCLQVQLGLMEVAWPEGLSETSEDGSSSEASGSITLLGTRPAQQQAPQGGTGSGSSPQRLKLSQRLEGVTSLLSAGSSVRLRKSRLGSPTPPAGGPGCDDSGPSPGAAAAAAAAPDAAPGGVPAQAQAEPSLTHGTCGPAAPPGSAAPGRTSTPPPGGRQSCVPGQPAGAPSAASSPSLARTSASRLLAGAGGSGGLFFGRGGSGSRRVASEHGPPGAGAAAAAPAPDSCFNGLRVRMGVVTGSVPWDVGVTGGTGSSVDACAAPAAIMNSSLYKLALDVSDAGNGGQILVDSATFAKIKEELAPLGAVDAGGINYARLAAASRPLGHALLAHGWLGRVCGSLAGRGGVQGKARPRHVDEAVVLDMGLYQQSAPMAPTTPTTPTTPPGAGDWGRSSLPGAMPLPLDPAGEPQAAAAPGCSLPTSPQSLRGGAWAGDGLGGWPGGGGGHNVSPGGAAALASPLGSASHAGARLRLYQILPPTLAGRALVWGNALALRGTWACLDAPYFEAPGALWFSLGPSPSSATSASVRDWSGGLHAMPSLPTATSCSCSLHAQHSRRLAGTPSSLLWPSQVKSQQSLQLQLCPQLARPSPLIAAGHAHQQQQAADTGPSWQDQVVQSPQPSPAAHDGQLLQQVQELAVASELATPCARGASAGTACGSCGSCAVPRCVLLPHVTLLFVSVEGAKLLRKQLLREAHCQLSLLMMEALRHVSGGYMCRMQAGDLKYMVAFASPLGALQWGLLVQEAAMYLQYPATWDRVPQLRPEHDVRGQLVFRGPRLKMGLCQGTPRTVMPDHVGRADYYGASVNMAARYMDAAAHGGQIACELDLALAVVSHVNHVAEGVQGASCCAGHGPEAAGAGGHKQQPERHSSGSSFSFSSGRSSPHRGEGPLRAAAAVAAAVAASAAAAPASEVGAAGSSSLPSTPTSQACSKPSQDGSCFSGAHSSQGSSPVARHGARGDMPCGAWQQQPQPQPQLQQHPPPLATASAALAAGCGSCGCGACCCCVVAGSAAQPSVFSLPDVAAVPASVEVHCLGAFRFKGSALQVVQMANVSLSSLEGRARFTPAAPPKGKGDRVAARHGLAGRSLCFPLPALAAQYRARVPPHVLECSAAADLPDVSPGPGSPAGRSRDTDQRCDSPPGGLRALGLLRVASLSQHVLQRSPRQPGVARAAARDDEAEVGACAPAAEK